MPLPTHGRYAYSPIKGRPVYDWPGGKRLAVHAARRERIWLARAGDNARQAIDLPDGAAP